VTLFSSWLYAWGDPHDRWAVDKWAHFFGAFSAFALGGWLLALFGIVAVESVESTRWVLLAPNARSSILNGVKPWPWLTDRVSLKDILAGLLGAGAGHLLL
jgi:hypothetical protein